MLGVEPQQATEAGLDTVMPRTDTTSVGAEQPLGTQGKCVPNEGRKPDAKGASAGDRGKGAVRDGAEQGTTGVQVVQAPRRADGDRGMGARVVRAPRRVDKDETAGAQVTCTPRREKDQRASEVVRKPGPRTTTIAEGCRRELLRAAGMQGTGRRAEGPSVQGHRGRRALGRKQRADRRTGHTGERGRAPDEPTRLIDGHMGRAPDKDTKGWTSGCEGKPRPAPSDQGESLGDGKPSAMRSTRARMRATLGQYSQVGGPLEQGKGVWGHIPDGTRRDLSEATRGRWSAWD